ncbi:MAG TPA: hypothetical protein VIK64_15705, partial [Anaerolineales bacterium]
MLRFVISLFIVLHGLVHLWYFTLSQRLVEFKPEMGWSGRSWIFTNFLGDSTTRSLASVLYVLATIAFVVSGIGILVRAEWWRPVLVGSAVFSAAIILLLWDGGLQLLVNKGLVGFTISVMIL